MVEMNDNKASSALEKKYEIIFHEARDGIVLADCDTGKILECNLEFERQTGRPINLLKEMKIWELRPRNKVEEAKQKYEEICLIGYGESDGLEYQMPDGGITPVEFHAKKVKISDRYFILSITRDITKHHMMEKELRESEKLYRTIFETSGTAMAIDDENCVLKLVNNRFAKLAGCEKWELEGKRSWMEFIDPKYLEQMKRISDKRKADPHHKHPATYEFEWIDNFNQKHDILINSDTLVDTKMTVASLLDITEYKKAQSEIEAAKIQAFNARESERLKSELLSMVSHELKTPLTSIKGQVTSLLRANVDWTEKEKKEFLESINRETDRLNRLINDLLDMTKLESGTMGFEFDYFHPSEIIDSILGELKHILSEHEISIVIETGVPKIYVDITRIGQVIVNLVDNASKFSPPGTCVSIEAKSNKDGRLIFSVQDSGTGIHPDEQIHIFDRFFQVKSSRKSSVKGTGLGLAICRAIVEAHNGVIYFDSTLEKGSTFYVEIPFDEKLR